MASRVISNPGRRSTVRAALCAVALLWCAAPAVAATTPTPAKDTFIGAVTGGTGKLAGDTGKIKALLHITPSANPVRKLQITMLGASCGTAAHCLRLSGTLSGTIRPRGQAIRDVGKRFELSLTGSLGAFKDATATGTVTGVGFIRQGHEGLMLTVQTARGRITIAAVSPKVPGFTSP